jgi:hypothetical protein
VLEPESAAFRIGLLGPSRIGKTSLITALLAESQQLLAGSQVVQSRFHSERRSGCCGERDDRGMTGAGVTLGDGYQRCAGVTRVKSGAAVPCCLMCDQRQ